MPGRPLLEAVVPSCPRSPLALLASLAFVQIDGEETEAAQLSVAGGWRGQGGCAAKNIPTLNSKTSQLHFPPERRRSSTDAVKRLALTGGPPKTFPSDEHADGF